MSDEALIATAIGELFKVSEDSLVIGLTGRTGSGCSTVASILATALHSELTLPSAQSPPPGHESRKDRIVQDWLGSHWQPFTTLSVSHAITALALEAGPEPFSRFAQNHLKTNPFAAHDDLLKQTSDTARTCADILLRLPSASNAELRQAYSFYFSDLPVAAERLKNLIKARQEGGFTSLFQALGDNLRRSGHALTGAADPSKLLTIPRRLHALIELGRAHNELVGHLHHYFVIDAIRHPHEVVYLRERVSRFYAVAVLTDDDSRRDRLGKLNYRAKEIEALDAKEYPGFDSDLRGYDRYISQDIQACIRAADIFLSNPGKWHSSPDIRELTRVTCRYVALMQHPGLVTPTLYERCMQVASAARVNSGCISRQVGAVVTNSDYLIKAVGWNDPPRGHVPCAFRYSRDLLRKVGDLEAFSDFEKNNASFRKELQKHPLIEKEAEHINGRHVTYCFKTFYNKLTGEKNQVHTRALHAEENAFLQVARNGGQGLEGGHLFTTSSPCELCAKKACQLGIAAIHFIDPYPGISGEHILTAGRQPLRQVLFTGAIGRAYHGLYEAMMPYKDELEMLRPHQQILSPTVSTRGALPLGDDAAPR